MSVGTRRVGKTTPKCISFQSFWQVREVALSPLWCLFWLKCSQDVFAHHKPGMLELCTCYRSLIGKWMGYWQMEKQTNELYFASLHFSMLITAVCWFFTCCPKEQSGSKCKSTLLNSSYVLPGVDSFQECIKRYFPLIDQYKHTMWVGVWEERSHTLEYFPLHIQNSYTGGGYIELALLSGTEKLA